MLNPTMLTRQDLKNRCHILKRHLTMLTRPSPNMPCHALSPEGARQGSVGPTMLTRLILMLHPTMLKLYRQILMLHHVMLKLHRQIRHLICRQELLRPVTQDKLTMDRSANRVAYCYAAHSHLVQEIRYANWVEDRYAAHWVEDRYANGVEEIRYASVRRRTGRRHCPNPR